MTSQEFANLENDGQINLTAAMEYQLRSNHFPPVPTEMIAVAVAAVEACRENDPEKLINSPYEHRRHGFQVPAHAIIEAYHLDPWVYNEDDEDY